MKTSDMAWVQSQAQLYSSLHRDATAGTGNHPMRASGTSGLSPAQAANVFVDELLGLIDSYARYFNELIEKDWPEAKCLIFRTASARPGFMLLRGKDKLVVIAEQGAVLVKVLNVQAYQEQLIDQFCFELRIDQQNIHLWVNHDDQMLVNVEMVARVYLGPFFAQGAQGFGAQRKLFTPANNLQKIGSGSHQSPRVP